MTLRSAYQPIDSLSHQRLVGHEALVRATDDAGKAVSPQRIFGSCATPGAVRSLDEACRTLHSRGFASAKVGDQWLFLNVDASVFDLASRLDPVDILFATVLDAGLSPSQVVIELLEGNLPDGGEFEVWTQALKERGFLLALDDFGAGHSNFDRVFRLQPQIVKLDRCVIARAGLDKTVRRVTTQMISLLHECGALVLVEGVESSHEAAIALDFDVDFVQGYFFGRPSSALLEPESRNDALFWCGTVVTRALLESIAYRSVYARMPKRSNMPNAL